MWRCDNVGDLGEPATCHLFRFLSILLEASPLDPSRLIALCAPVIIHMLQADMLQADTRATPCSQPLQLRAYATAAVWLMAEAASLTHSYLSCALCSSMILSPHDMRKHIDCQRKSTTFGIRYLADKLPERDEIWHNDKSAPRLRNSSSKRPLGCQNCNDFLVHCLAERDKIWRDYGIGPLQVVSDCGELWSICTLPTGLTKFWMRVSRTILVRARRNLAALWVWLFNTYKCKKNLTV